MDLLSKIYDKVVKLNGLIHIDMVSTPINNNHLTFGET